MPTTETPADKTMRRWYEGKLAERLMQAASMEKNRQLLRRGAMKQQDGTLGELPTGEPDEEDDVHIHIGDIHASSQQASPQSLPVGVASEKRSGWSDWGKTAAVAAALLGGGAAAGALPYMLSGDDTAPPATESNDTWLEYDGHKFVPGE